MSCCPPTGLCFGGADGEAMGGRGNVSCDFVDLVEFREWYFSTAPIILFKVSNTYTYV